MLELSHVYKSYQSKNVVHDVSFQVEEGVFVSIVGKSGSGKTTLLNLIGTMDRPDSGTITFQGRTLTSNSETQNAHYRNHDIGFIFQNFHLEPAYTVYENVTLPLLIADDTHRMRERAEQVLELVGMSEFIKRKATNLSGGEQQRICIARAMILQPSLILADEPCGNLDTENTNKVMELLRNLVSEKRTVLLVTHDPESAEKTDRILTMSDGKLVSDVRNPR